MLRIQMQMLANQILARDQARRPQGGTAHLLGKSKLRSRSTIPKESQQLNVWHLKLCMMSLLVHLRAVVTKKQP